MEIESNAAWIIIIQKRAFTRFHKDIMCLSWNTFCKYFAYGVNVHELSMLVLRHEENVTLSDLEKRRTI